MIYYIIYHVQNDTNHDHPGPEERVRNPVASPLRLQIHSRFHYVPRKPGKSWRRLPNVSSEEVFLVKFHFRGLRKQDSVCSLQRCPLKPLRLHLRVFFRAGERECEEGGRGEGRKRTLREAKPRIKQCVRTTGNTIWKHTAKRAGNTADSRSTGMILTSPQRVRTGGSSHSLPK